MKLESRPLYEALKQLQPAIDKGPLPILSHVLIESDGPMARLRATNLEVAIEVHVAAETEPGESYCLPSKTLLDTLQTFNGPCEIRANSDRTWQVTITCGDFYQDLSGMDASDYPAWTELQDLTAYPVSRSEFLDTCGAVTHAASKCDSRFMLNAVLFDGEAKRLMATDGHRIKYQAANWLGTGTGLVPIAGLQKAMKALKLSRDNGLIVAIEEKNLVVNGANIRITIRLMDGEYVDSKLNFTLGDLPVVTMPKKSMEKAMRLTRIMLSSGSPYLKLHFRPFRVQFMTESDSGHARTEIEGMVPPELQGTEVNVNWMYFSQAIKAAPAIVPLSVAGTFITLGNEFICQIKPKEATA